MHANFWQSGRKQGVMTQRDFAVNKAPQRSWSRMLQYLALKPRGRDLLERVPQAGVNGSIQPSHVIFLVNGLFGTPSNWHAIIEEMERKTDRLQVLVHASQTNKRMGTFEGIDTCGERLADEMRSVVAQHPSLVKISVVGHSMGGLLLRYAVAALYSPATGTIAGLTPAHFVSMATPHLGCDGAGEAQVPFISWAGPLRPLLQRISVPTAVTFFKRTGLQFFRADGTVEPGQVKPLLLRMTEDDHERGLHFYSALKSFASRTAYANTSLDHLVSWPNSSLRFMQQLPELPDMRTTAQGVVLEDDIMTAFDTPMGHELAQHLKSSSTSSLSESPALHSPGLQLSGTEEAADQCVNLMLGRLQQLPWRRIDVCFTGSTLAVLSHNHIQARWTWLNENGRGVAIHLVEQIVQLEETHSQLKQRSGEEPSSFARFPVEAVDEEKETGALAVLSLQESEMDIGGLCQSSSQASEVLK